MTPDHLRPFLSTTKPNQLTIDSSILATEAWNLPVAGTALGGRLATLEAGVEYTADWLPSRLVFVFDFEGVDDGGTADSCSAVISGGLGWLARRGLYINSFCDTSAPCVPASWAGARTALPDNAE